MQEEVENRTLTLVVSGTKFTGRMFKAAISKYMAHRKEKKLEKQRSRDAPVVPHEDFEMPADDRNCTGHFGADAFCLALHGADLHIRSGAWPAQHCNCSTWRGCAAYLFSAERCDPFSHGIFD